MSVSLTYFHFLQKNRQMKRPRDENHKTLVYNKLFFITAQRMCRTSYLRANNRWSELL